MEKLPQGGLITKVIPGSIGHEIGLEPGDRLLLVDDQPVEDLIDYEYLTGEDVLTLTILQRDGDICCWEVDKQPYEDLGLVFDSPVFDGVRHCANRCLFCFVDQLPPDVRESLRLKDDDYRMSFLTGSYITCTNMKKEDYNRIQQLHLSPLYISVHTVDPILRQKLLGRKQPAEILLTLQRLISMGATIHAQVVLCPDINDGAVLDQTIEALLGLWPGVASLAVVPVGLTAYQTHQELRPFTPEEAGQVLEQLASWQKKAEEKTGTPFVYGADEFYLKAGRKFPPAEHYGEFHQLEDGVGMTALFASQWEKCRETWPEQGPKERIGIVAGVSGAAAIGSMLGDLTEKYPNVEMVTVENKFFSGYITVTGLLTGTCLKAAIKKGEYDRLILPDCMLRHGQQVLLDDITLEELEQELDCRITVVGPSAQELIEGIWKEE